MKRNAAKRSTTRRSVFVISAFLMAMLFVVGAQNEAAAQGADDAAQAEAGQAVYEMSCAGCHALDGTGVEGRGRPLTGIASQGDRATHIASITDGKGGMPAFGERLSADEIEQAASYVRLTFLAAPEPATTAAETETELALTGVGSTGLAIIGLTLLAGGVQLMTWSRRNQELD